MEAKRIDQYMSSSGVYENVQGALPKRSSSSGARPTVQQQQQVQAARAETPDTASVDSDFPPTNLTTNQPTAQQGQPSDPSDPPTSPSHLPPPHQHRYKRTSSSTASPTPSKASRTRDPETRAPRRPGQKLKRGWGQLELALEVAGRDVKDASSGVLKDLRRFSGGEGGGFGGGDGMFFLFGFFSSRLLFCLLYLSLFWVFLLCWGVGGWVVLAFLPACLLTCLPAYLPACPLPCVTCIQERNIEANLHCVTAQFRALPRRVVEAELGGVGEGLRGRCGRLRFR